MFTYFPATQIKRYLHRKVQNTTLHAHSANSHSCTLSLSYLNAEMIIKGIQTMYTEIIWLLVNRQLTTSQSSQKIHFTDLQIASTFFYQHSLSQIWLCNETK